MRSLSFLLPILLVGCVPGTIESTGGSAPGGSSGNDAPDAAIGGGGNPDGAAASSDAAINCKAKVTSVGSGHHNAGQDCQQGCHNHGFSMSGTLYAAANSTTPVIGATITAKDANGKLVDMVSQNDGNFYTTTTVAFPVTVVASLCPNPNHAMAGQITAGNGGCNKSGCHQAGAQGKIYLP
jgi:hypothetical protein